MSKAQNLINDFIKDYDNDYDLDSFIILDDTFYVESLAATDIIDYMTAEGIDFTYAGDPEETGRCLVKLK